jgi:hypothetical protein
VVLTASIHLFSYRTTIRAKSLSSSAVGAEDVGTVCQETATHKRRVASIANKAVAVPVALFEGDELGATKSGDGFCATAALLSKQVPKAVSAVGLVLTRGELLASKHLVAVAAGEAVTMPGSGLVGDATLVDHSIALHAALSILLFIAGHADHLLITGDEALVANGLLADLAAEALLMPLLALVLILLHTSAKDISAAVTASSKVVVMTVGAVELLILGGKGLVNQGVLAVAALEALLMPMLLFIRQILGVSANGRLALFASVGEEVLIALDAVRMLLAQDVPVPSEVQVAVEAAEVPAMPVLVHGAGVFARKDQPCISANIVRP